MAKFGNQYSLKEALSSMIGELHIEQKLQEVQIRSLWRELLGDTVANKYDQNKFERRSALGQSECVFFEAGTELSKSELVVLINSKMGMSVLGDMIIY